MISLREREILVVDDDHDAMEVLEYVIALEGAIVRTAQNSREALELLLSWTPDVMLLDISMPEMDGVDLLTTIRRTARLREVPAVAVTAHVYERDKDRSARAGFAAHLCKPYDIETLLKVIGDLVEKKPATSASDA